MELSIVAFFVSCWVNLAWVFASIEDLAKSSPAVQTTVDIKPGAGRQEVLEKLGGFVCKFHYKAQGGTKEEWSLSISSSEAKKEFLCSIERPSGKSYLFFEEFKLEVSGARLQTVLLEKEPGVVLSEVEYAVNKKENSVQDSPGKFNSQLSKVQVYARKPSKVKKDL